MNFPKKKSKYSIIRKYFMENDIDVKLISLIARHYNKVKLDEQTSNKIMKNYYIKYSYFIKNNLNQIIFDIYQIIRYHDINKVCEYYKLLKLGKIKNDRLPEWRMDSKENYFEKGYFKYN